MTHETPQQLAERIANACRNQPVMQVMEICGTHTVSIFRNGIRSLLPENLKLVSGPGCPVCVTAQRHIDAAIELAMHPDVTIATYGDMVRVPGRSGSLETRRADGADIRVVTSAQAALNLAIRQPDRPVVFLAVGFETTAPATAAVILEADARNVENFFILSSHKLVMPAMRALLNAADVPLDGFLCPGHVSVVLGSNEYTPIVTEYGKPCVVAGFEPVSILLGLAMLTEMIAEGKPRLDNAYPGVVHPEGNAVARALMQKVFTIADTPWRALGIIPESGMELAEPYKRFDAMEHFGIVPGEDHDDPRCRCGEVIQGKASPAECPLFGKACTPMNPIGPCMVSSEGTCSAWYKYRPRSA